MIYKEYINNDIINYESGLNHFSKKEALYEKYLFKFFSNILYYFLISIQKAIPFFIPLGAILWFKVKK